MKCAVYARMARCDDPADMETQVVALTELAESKGYEVARTFSEVAPRNVGLEERRALREMLEDVAEDMYDAVVVRDPSRIAHSGVHEAGFALDALVLTETSVVTPEREFDPTDRSDALALYMLMYGSGTGQISSAEIEKHPYLRPFRA